MSKKEDKVVAIDKKVTSEIFNAPPPDFVPVEMEVVVYYPTRLEYFASAVLQGLVVGRSEKDHRKCVGNAISLAKELIEYVDSAKD